MKSKRSFLVHIIFWLMTVIIPIIGVINSNLDTYEITVKYGYFAIINLSIFYINYTLLIPLLIQQRKRYGLYMLSIVLIIVVMAVIKTFLATVYSKIVLSHDVSASSAPLYEELGTFAVQAIFTSGFFIVVSALLKFAIDWVGNENVQKNLVSEKREMELQFLKSQLNPHFLFNSLNNIYSLAYQKSDKTADAILKLSEIMRYMIYESNDSWVALRKEIDYVESFIELQKLRFKDGAFVELTLQGEIDNQHIVPLILISFVENAFKHGVANDPEHPIRINIIANQKILHFSITNKKNTHNKDEMGGVGLNNVERRLQLLYPERYKLNIVNSTTHYTSELMLDI